MLTGKVLKASDYSGRDYVQYMHGSPPRSWTLTLVLALVDVLEPSLQLGFGSVLAVAFLLQSRLDLQSLYRMDE
jgi:hypothetical protein